MDYLLEYVIVLIVTYCYYPFNSYPIAYFLALDGIYSTLAFMRLQSRNLTQSQVLEKIGILYNIDFIDRYIYYIAVSFFYQYLQLLFWLNESFSTYLIILLLLVFAPPNQINLLHKTWLNPTFSILGEIRIKVSKTVCAFILARIMNFLSLVCVDLRPNIHTAELYPLMKSATLSNTPKTLLNFLIATLVQYTQNNGRTMSSRLIRVVYRYNTGKKINTVKSEEQAKEQIVKVLVERRFNELIRPTTLQTVFYLYQSKEDGLLYTIFTEFEYRILQIGSIYTLTKSILGIPAYYAAIFSSILCLYRIYANVTDHRKDFIKNETQKSSNDNYNVIDESERVVRAMIGRIVGLIIGSISPMNYLLTILVSELTYYLIIQFEYGIVLLLKNYFSINYASLESLYKIISETTDYEMRYILITLLLISNYWSLLLLISSLILAPNFTAIIVIIFNVILLRISNFNLLHLSFIIFQTFFYPHYSYYLKKILYSFDKNNNLIFKIYNTNANTNTNTNNNTNNNGKVSSDAIVTLNMVDSYYPSKDTFNTVVSASIVEKVEDQDDRKKDIKDMNDVEIREDLQNILERSVKGLDSPVISDEATINLLKSIKNNSGIISLDKSMYLGYSEDEDKNDIDELSLYSEY